MDIYFNSILISLSIIGIAGIGLVIFSTFGKKILGKMEVQNSKIEAQTNIFTEFIKHAKNDSEEVRQMVFEQQAKIDRGERKLDDFTQIVADLHKRHKNQDH